MNTQELSTEAQPRWLVPPHVGQMVELKHALAGGNVQGKGNNPNQPKIKFVNPNTGNYDRNIKHAASLKLPMIKKDMYRGKTVIVAGSGPSLTDEVVLRELRQYVEEEQDNLIVVACKAAIKVLHENGIKVDYGVSMDPGAHIACDEKISRVVGVKHIIATSSDPALFEYLKDEQVLLFHSATGYKHELKLYHDLFENAWVAGGGYNVVNRAVSVAQYMGFKKIILAGTDCGWRDGHTFYADGSEQRPGIDMEDKGIVDGIRWNTRPDMLASGIALARVAKKAGQEKFVILGDVIPAKLRHKSDEFLSNCGDFVTQ